MYDSRERCGKTSGVRSRRYPFLPLLLPACAWLGSLAKVGKERTNALSLWLFDGVRLHSSNYGRDKQMPRHVFGKLSRSLAGIRLKCHARLWKRDLHAVERLRADRAKSRLKLHRSAGADLRTGCRNPRAGWQNGARE